MITRCVCVYVCPLPDVRRRGAASPTKGQIVVVLSYHKVELVWLARLLTPWDCMHGAV